MSWLARIKKTNSTPESAPTKPTRGTFVGFVGIHQEDVQKSGEESSALSCALAESANDPAAPVVARQDALAIPNASGAFTACGVAMTAHELDVLLAQLALFTDRGLNLDDAEALAERLTYRDRQRDDRRLCLECQHLFGGPDARRCSQWLKIGQINGPAIPADLPTILQRCRAFTDCLGQWD